MLSDDDMFIQHWLIKLPHTWDNLCWVYDLSSLDLTIPFPLDVNCEQCLDRKDEWVRKYKDKVKK